MLYSEVLIVSIWKYAMKIGMGKRNVLDVNQGCIEPPKVARGDATSHSPCIDGIVLSVTKNNVSG